VLMAIGMALVVPAVIGTLALTAYAPPAEAAAPDEDMDYDAAPEDSVQAVQDDTSAAPADGGGAEPAPAAAPAKKD